MPNNSQNVQYTFYPEFSEFITLYRGVTKVWIADGGEEYPGEPGMLRAEYVDGNSQDIGFVSDYYKAKEAYGGDLSFEQWVAILLAIPDNASDSEAYGVGTRPSTNSQGEVIHVPVQDGDATYHNNSKYWAEQSKEYTNGKDLNNQSVQARETDNALYYKNQSRLWANNNNGSTEPTATNNSMYWAETSKIWTNGKNLSDTDVQPTNNAQYWSEQARGWTNNKDGQPGQFSATNNSKYWAEQSKEYSIGENLAGTQVQNNNSKEFSLQSESWAKGTRNNITDNDRQNASTDNSKYYSDLSRDWAGGSQGDVPSSTNNAHYWATEAAGSAEQASGYKADAGTSAGQAGQSASRAEKWAVGTSTGADPSVNDKNSRAWAEESKGYADGIGLDGTTALHANDNAKFYRDEAKGWANYGTDGSTPGEYTNAKYYAGQAGNSATRAESWAVGSSTGASPTVGQDAKSWAEQAKSYSDGKSLDGSTDIRSDNAKRYSRDAEAWAVGTRDGNAVPSTSPEYHNNALYWANFANQKATEIQAATATVSYQNSTSGTIVPTGTWSPNPLPEKGKYLWTRTAWQWTPQNITEVYMVNYIGEDGAGNVASVNGQTGNVSLYADNITMSSSDATTIAGKLTSITNAQIDALFV